MSKWALVWALVIGVGAIIHTSTTGAPVSGVASGDDWTPRVVGKALDFNIREGGVFRGGVAISQGNSLVVRFDNGDFDRYSQPLHMISESAYDVPQVSSDGRWIAVAVGQEHEAGMGDDRAELPPILRLDRRTRRVARLTPNDIPHEDWFFNWALARDGQRIFIASAHFLRVYDALSLKLLEKRAWPHAIEYRKPMSGFAQDQMNAGIFDLARGCFRLAHFQGQHIQLLAYDLRTRRVTRQTLKLKTADSLTRQRYDYPAVFYAPDARTLWIAERYPGSKGARWQVIDAQSGRFLWSRACRDFSGFCAGGKLALWKNWRHLMVYEVHSGTKIRTLPLADSNAYLASSDEKWLLSDAMSQRLMRQRLR